MHNVTNSPHVTNNPVYRAVPASPHPAPAPPGQWWNTTPPRRSFTTTMLITVGIIVAMVVTIGVFGFYALYIGVTATVVGTVLALVPLVILLIAVRWIDRWEPEPRRALLFAFLWGAGVSVAAAIVVQLGVEHLTLGSDMQVPSDAFGAVVQAPIVEETAKGIGLLLLVAMARRNFDGPVDGVVYAAMIATGFTFTEDVLYFAGTLADEGTEALATVWVLRSIFSPFVHTLCTACTGLAIGFALERRPNASVLPHWFLGLAGAIILHALWNGGAYFAHNFVQFYLVIQVPLFAFAIYLVVTLRRRETKTTRARLAEYAAAGWLARGEVDWFGTPAGRRSAMTWAKSRPGNKGPVMKQLIRSVTALAYGRQRALRDMATSAWPVEEQQLLGAVTRERAALLQ